MHIPAVSKASEAVHASSEGTAASPALPHVLLGGVVAHLVIGLPLGGVAQRVEGCADCLEGALRTRRAILVWMELKRLLI